MDLINKHKAQPRLVFNGLITTKLNAPSLKSKMVERTHLLDRLSEAREFPLIVISGVAGSGKTSLACQWASRDELSLAWYSVDKSDNDFNLFSQYLLASLSLADDDLSTLLEADLRAAGSFTEKQLVARLIQNVSCLANDLYLVLDDYHCITSRVVHDIVAGLLNHTPPNLHLVILTRHDIPFSLSPFRVRNQIMEISALDMRFTEAEAERFFTDVIPVRLTTQKAHEIARHMDGWIGGLQLLGLSLKGRNAQEDLGELLSKGNRKIWDYLMEEVITVQPHKVRSFLEATAPLDRFSADLAREVTGMRDAGEVLDAIYRNNLFLVPLDAGSQWYRLSPSPLGSAQGTDEGVITRKAVQSLPKGSAMVCRSGLSGRRIPQRVRLRGFRVRGRLDGRLHAADQRQARIRLGQPLARETSRPHSEEQNASPASRLRAEDRMLPASRHRGDSQGHREGPGTCVQSLPRGEEDLLRGRLHILPSRLLLLLPRSRTPGSRAT